MSSSYRDLNYTDYGFAPATTVGGGVPVRRRRVGDRQQTARRLLFEAVEFSYDPELDVDWDAPLDADGHWLAAEHVSLHGSPVWDALSDGQRQELARHELVSMLSFVVDAQGLLSMLMFRDVMEGEGLADDYSRFLLSGVHGESRNATMIGRLINKTGLDVYQFPVAVQRLQRLVMLIPNGPLGRGFVLLLHELTGQLLCRLAADAGTHRLARQVGSIHAVVSRRHVEFARDELYRAVDSRRLLPPVLADVFLALLCVLMVSLVVNPQVYASVGLTSRAGRKAARRGDGRRRTAVLLGPYLQVANDAGMLQTPVARAILRAAGLAYLPGD